MSNIIIKKCSIGNYLVASPRPYVASARSCLFSSLDTALVFALVFNKKNMNIKQYFSYDLPAEVVVFLVALPLCLGIALASGAPMFSGVIAGIIGGIVAGFFSGSNVSVSGPAAGLTTIVLASITELGSYPVFLLCVVLAGVMQIMLGYARAGVIGHFVPVSVIKGMLGSIGIILILKQIPHALGYDANFEGDQSFLQLDGENTFSALVQAFSFITPGAVLLALVSIGVLLVWESDALRDKKLTKYVPGPLLVVFLGIALNYLFLHHVPYFAINEQEHLVSMPVLASLADFPSLFTLPDFSQWADPRILMVAATIAVVASLETLLSIEASDKLDKSRRITPLDRELKAQGMANIVSGMVGGLPVTSVIVRSSANIHAGARSKASSITHGVILLLAVLAIPTILKLIPLSSLAAILLMVGFKLTKPALYQSMWKKGPSQFLPFIVTIAAVLLTDLLEGVLIGLVVSVFFILKSNFREAILMVSEGKNYLIQMTKDVSFLNKAALREKLIKIPANASLLIDATNARFIDHDIRETIKDFMEEAKAKNIHVNLKNF